MKNEEDAVPGTHESWTSITILFPILPKLNFYNLDSKFVSRPHYAGKKIENETLCFSPLSHLFITVLHSLTLVCGAHKQELDTLKLELNGYGRRPIAALIKLIFPIVYPFLRKHNWLIRDEVLVGTMPKPYRKN